MTQAFATLTHRTSRADAGPATGPRSPTSLAGLILILSSALILLGVVMVFSADGSLDRPFFPEEPLKSISVRQGLFALLALGAMWMAYAGGHQWLRWRGPRIDTERQDEPGRHATSTRIQPAVVLLGLVLLCLICVLLPDIGAERRGSRRWLQFGPPQYGLGFQPSELAKLGMVVFLAAWLARRQDIMGRFWKGIVPAAGIVAAICGLVIVQDLGTAALLALVGGMMILAAGARWWHAALLALPGLAGFIAMVFAEPYRVARIMNYRDLWADPLGGGYHAIQSLVTITSGGWWGRGLGAGLQKYGYLPEAHTDFIFGVICEELGLVGGLIVLAMFATMVLLGWQVMTASADSFGKLLALGATALIGFQAAMNIAVVTVTIPTKGISLPLVSAGGSGVVFYAVTLALLASVGRRPASSET